MSNESIVQQAQNAASFDDASKVVEEIRKALDALGPLLNEFTCEQRCMIKLQSDRGVDYPMMWYNEDDFVAYYGDRRDDYTWVEEGWMSSSQWKDC